MKTEIKEIYKCDHCRKLYQQKNACIEHEPRCPKNPINIPKCIGCKYLENIGIQYEPQVQNNDDLFNGNGFRCKLKDMFMYHPRAEFGQYGVPDYVEFKGDEIDQQRMSSACDDFENLYEKWNEIFNK